MATQSLGTAALAVFISRELPFSNAAPFLPSAKEKIEPAESSWGAPPGEVSSSAFASPLILEIILILRCLNRGFRDQLDFFKHKHIGRELLQFSLFYQFGTKDFDLVESMNGVPPTKMSEATRLAASIDYLDTGSDYIAQSLMQSGSYDPGYDGGTSMKFNYITKTSPIKSTNPSSVARLGETELGKLLLERVETLADMRDQYETDEVQPLDKHLHLCRCYKFLVLSLHKQCSQFVVVTSKSSMSLGGMGSLDEGSKLYVERETVDGTKFWVRISCRCSFHIEM